MLNILIVSQDDISVEQNPCGSKSYVINLVNFLNEQNINIQYWGTISFFSKNIINTPIVPICKKDVSSLKFITKLLVKVIFYSIEKDIIIHAQKPLEMLPFVVFNKKNKKILTLHGQELKRVRFKKGKIYSYFYRLIECYILKKTDKIIVVDNVTKNYYCSEYRWIDNKISTIPIGVNTKKFSPKDLNKLQINPDIINVKTKYTLIFVGRLEKEKNIKFLIDSFEIIKQKISSVKLLIVGKGSCQKELEHYVKMKNLSGIIFTGEIENKNIPDLLVYSDVFVLSSHYEGSPTVIKEALACNTAVVSLDVGDVKTLIKDIKGCFIAKNNIYNFAEKVLDSLSQLKELDAREKILKFSYESIGLQTLQLYKELMNKGKS